MFRRHDIRIKALQAIYSNDITYKENCIAGLSQVLKLYENMVKETEALSYFFIDLTLQITDYAENIAQIERQKLLNKNMNATKVHHRLHENVVVQALQNTVDNYFKNKRIKRIRIDDQDLIHQLFFSLYENATYKEYVNTATHTQEEDIDLVVVILKQIIQNNEAVEGFIEDNFLNAIEDTQPILHYIIDVVRDYPTLQIESISSQKENINFGKELIENCIEKSDFIELIITKNANNWDMERIVMIDRVILKLALCEFLYFDNIPIKVSLNEYIEIAKEFSTAESKNFINGILDTLQKKLTEEGKISNAKKASTHSEA